MFSVTIVIARCPPLSFLLTVRFGHAEGFPPGLHRAVRV